MARRPGTIGHHVPAPGPYPVTGHPAGARGEGQQLAVPTRSPAACLGHLVPGTGQVTGRVADHQPGITGTRRRICRPDTSARAGGRHGCP